MVKTLSLLLAISVVLVAAPGCGKKVDANKTLECAQNQPYKAEADCKSCCGGDFKLKDTVCLCYE
jgi:hypothetical protein